MLTTAAFGRLAALDVSVVAPHGAGAGQDAAAAQVGAKVRRYAPYLRDLAADGIAYRPLVWTTWGRPHEDAAAAVASMAAAAGRRLGVPSHALAARARTAVGVALWRRAARMVAACGPRLARDDVAGLLPAAGRALRARGVVGRPDPPDVVSDMDTQLAPPARRPAHPVPTLASPAWGTGVEPAAAAAVGSGSTVGRAASDRRMRELVMADEDVQDVAGEGYSGAPWGGVSSDAVSGLAVARGGGAVSLVAGRPSQSERTAMGT